MTNLKITTALLTVLLLLFSCSHKNETGTLFSHADALMEEHPDSVLRLLDLPPEEIEELSDKECARYALLLARATDKCKLSLLPCDSLLNVALDYYDDDEKEKAVALLYKGRLEAEMNSTENAIAHLQEGLLILTNFPKEVETKRHILSSLGNLYFDTGYYEEAGKIYQKLYKYCYTEKDKSIALNAISSYYCVTNNEDSTITNQKKALRYALAANDSSLIASSKFNLSLEFYQFDELDSALHYAQDAIKWLSDSQERGSYYSHLGSLLIEKGENEDLAIHYLKSNIENSNSRASDLLSLYEVEKKRKNYEAASAYLEEHVQIVDSLVSIEQSTKVQQLIYGYKTKLQIKEEQLKNQRAQEIIIISFSIISFLIILIYQNQINRKRRQQLKKDQELHQTQNKLSSLQAIIDNNESIIDFLQKKHTDLEEEHKIKEEQINIREQIIAKLQEEKQRLRKWLFTQSDIYKKIDSLSNSKVTDKKNIKVLTNAEQRKLKDTILSIYTEYADTLHQKYSKLTEDDIVLLCLQEAQLAPKAIAICFGYNDTHTINQRKLRIKQRMNEL